MEGYPLATIPPLVLQDGVHPSNIDAVGTITKWLTAIEAVANGSTTESLDKLFAEEAWWRDIVAIGWDITSKKGPKEIDAFLKKSKNGLKDLRPDQTGALCPSVQDMHGAKFLQSGFHFTTAIGSGRGLVRLINVSKTEWKCWTMHTRLDRLHLQDAIDEKRLADDYAHVPTHHSMDGFATNGANELNGHVKDDEPTVIVVGAGTQALVPLFSHKLTNNAGQSGVTLAACLQNVGIKTLVVERGASIGGLWRDRYRSVRTHTPSYHDEYPFMPYPKGWPRWQPREKLVSWMKSYAELMDVNIIYNSEIKNPEWDPSAREWTVDLETKGTKIKTLHPHHIVLATGTFAGEPNIPKIPNQSAFRGLMYHSKDHTSALDIPEINSKKVVIIGSGTSAHDIGQDMANSHAKSVTIIQRTPIFNFSAKALEHAYMHLWNTPGM
jgi:thioredoxin reductase